MSDHPTTRGIIRVCAVAGFLFALAGHPPAFATPYVNVTSEWSAGSFAFVPDTGFGEQGYPDGIAVSCFGGAASMGGGCSDSRTLNTSVTTTEDLSVSANSGIEVTNDSTHQFFGSLLFYLDLGPFNAGGPEIGVSVDNPLTQSATLESSITGFGVAGPSSGVATMTVACNTATGTIPLPPGTCGLDSPDSSEEMVFLALDSLLPGQSEQVPYAIAITADFKVPEPSALMILGTALLLLALLRPRRRAG